MYQQPRDDANGTETVLLVEPDHQLRRVIAASLEQQGLRVLQASDTGIAIRLLEQEDPELLTDVTAEFATFLCEMAAVL